MAARAHPRLVHAPVVRAVHSLELAAGLVDTRELVRSAAREAALPPARVAEVVLAAHEVAMNALTHGLGHGGVRIWAAEDELVCEIEDHGPGISDPFAGSKPPAIDRTRGRGLWITRQLCDQVEIESTPGGTLVRLRWRVY